MSAAHLQLADGEREEKRERVKGRSCLCRVPNIGLAYVRDEFSTLLSLPTFPEPIKFDRHRGLQRVAVKPVCHDFSSTGVYRVTAQSYDMIL